MDSRPRLFTRTRLAPTPSGFLHLGNLLSFVLTAGLAKRYGASLLLRIDDLDRERVRAAYIADIFDSLRYLGISCPEGPVNPEDFEQHFAQGHRLPLYQQALEKLRENNLVFACRCSRSSLGDQANVNGYPGTCREANIPLDQPGVSWRLRTDKASAIALQGLDGKRVMHPFPAGMRDVVVRKKNGDPSYQLASVVDDLHFGVDLVVRGQDLFDSTLAQLFLAQCLGEDRFLATTFVHHPLLSNAQGEKLSKSAGDTSIRYLREAGFGPGEIFQRVAAGLSLAETLGTWEELFDRIAPLLIPGLDAMPAR